MPLAKHRGPGTNGFRLWRSGVRDEHDNPGGFMFRLRTVTTLAIGYGVGYVMGSKAGRPAYERLVASVTTAANQLGIARASEGGPTSTDATNDELVSLRDSTTVGMPGQPDQGRDHAAIVTPTPAQARS